MVSPTVYSAPGRSAERDGSSARKAAVVSPTVSGTPKGSAERDGSSARTAFEVSPIVARTPKHRMSSSKLKEKNDGKRISSAIPISPTVTEANLEENKCREMIISPKTQQTNAQGTRTSGRNYTVSPIFGPHLFSLGPIGRSPMSVPPDVARLVKNLSDSVNNKGLFSSVGGEQPLSDGGSASKRKFSNNQTSSGSKKRDNRPGMFTPPPFNLSLLGSSQETSSTDEVTDEVVDAVPLAWAPSQDESEGNAKGSTDEDLQEVKMSAELQDFVLGKTTEVSAEVEQEWFRHEERARFFSARQRALLEKAKPGSSKGVRSLTPKVLLHKRSVKKGSCFKQSPYGVQRVVKQEHEDLYNLITKHNYRCILYRNSWAFTQDLADSIFSRGELSNHCLEVGIEFLQRTNKIKGKLIVSLQLTGYMMNEEWLKPMVVSTFKRTEVHSLSIMNQIHFPVLHEIAKGQKFGNHWYALCLNLEAGRFEALDSLPGEGNMGLISHATSLMNMIKHLWATYYEDSKIQIQNYELKIIDDPKQHVNHDCGYHVLYNIENWDGENIPLIGKEDVQKLRKIMPYNWANVDFNEATDFKWHLENNM